MDHASRPGSRSPGSPAAADQTLRELYQRLILEHSAHPANYGALADATHTRSLDNPLCGDMVTVYLRVGVPPAEPSAQPVPVILHAGFTGEGCAICRASASLMTGLVAGKTAAQAGALANELARLLLSKDNGPDEFPMLGDLTALRGLRAVPSRWRCGTLPWEALAAALDLPRPDFP